MSGEGQPGCQQARGRSTRAGGMRKPGNLLQEVQALLGRAHMAQKLAHESSTCARRCTQDGTPRLFMRRLRGAAPAPTLKSAARSRSAGWPLLRLRRLSLLRLRVRARGRLGLRHRPPLWLRPRLRAWCWLVLRLCPLSRLALRSLLTLLLALRLRFHLPPDPLPRRLPRPRLVLALRLLLRLRCRSDLGAAAFAPGPAAPPRGVFCGPRCFTSGTGGSPMGTGGCGGCSGAYSPAAPSRLSMLCTCHSPSARSSMSGVGSLLAPRVLPLASCSCRTGCCAPADAGASAGGWGGAGRSASASSTPSSPAALAASPTAGTARAGSPCSASSCCTTLRGATSSSGEGAATR